MHARIFSTPSILNSLINQTSRTSKILFRPCTHSFKKTRVEKGPRKSKKRWVSNERRILHILLNCISVISNLPVREFKNLEILRVHRVFSYKDRYSIEYEVRKLCTNNKQNRRRWSTKQESALQDIVKKTQNKNKWNEIARELFIYSKAEYFRQGKHCRQRFYKLKDGKGQCSLSGEFASDESSHSANSSQFHSHDDASFSTPESKNNPIQQKVKNQHFENSSMSNQLDQISKKQNGHILAGNHPKTPSKQAYPLKQESEKLRSTRGSFSEHKPHSFDFDHNVKVDESLHNEKQGAYGQQYQQNNDVKKEQIQDEQNAKKNQNLGPGMFMAGMGMNGMGMGMSMSMSMAMGQLERGVGGLDQRWYNMMGYWPLGGFSFNFQGFY